MGEAKTGWVKRVGVIGAGLMGHGIAQTFAAAGLEVNLTDTVPEVLERAPARIKNNLNLMAEAGRLSGGQIPEIMGRLNLKTDLASAVKEVDFVSESISENLKSKQELFEALDSLCPPRTILGTNTSSLPLSQVAARIKRRDKLITTHHLNPPHIIPLVEIMRGEETSEDTFQSTITLMRRCGWVPVVLKKEVPGYIINRLLTALFREAISLVQDGVAEAEDVDLAVKAGIGLRMPIMGLLEVADLAGLDLLEVMLRNLSPLVNSQPIPPALISEKVRRNELGGKTGKGFYDWHRRSLPDFIRWRDQNLHRLRLAFWDGKKETAGNP